MKQTREDLIKELGKLKIHQSMAARDELGKYASKEQLGDIADFILARDKRLVEPLVKHFKQEYCNNEQVEKGKLEAMKQTLKNAGIES